MLHVTKLYPDSLTGLTYTSLLPSWQILLVTKLYPESLTELTCTSLIPLLQISKLYHESLTELTYTSLLPPWQISKLYHESLTELTDTSLLPSWRRAKTLSPHNGTPCPHSHPGTGSWCLAHCRLFWTALEGHRTGRGYLRTLSLEAWPPGHSTPGRRSPWPSRTWPWLLAPEVVCSRIADVATRPRLSRTRSQFYFGDPCVFNDELFSCCSCLWCIEDRPQRDLNLSKIGCFWYDWRTQDDIIYLNTFVTAVSPKILRKPPKHIPKSDPSIKKLNNGSGNLASQIFQPAPSNWVRWSLTFDRNKALPVFFTPFLEGCYFYPLKLIYLSIHPPSSCRRQLLL